MIKSWLCKDSDIYIEFGDGVFYQASLDGSEVAITADYPRPYPFSIVSIRRALKKKSLLAPLSIILNRTLMGSALGGPYLLKRGPYAG